MLLLKQCVMVICRPGITSSFLFGIYELFTVLPGTGCPIISVIHEDLPRLAILPPTICCFWGKYLIGVVKPLRVRADLFAGSFR